MSRDPDVYPEPDVFKPERFLTPNGGVSDLHDPKKFVFGFGRRLVRISPTRGIQFDDPDVYRICPGRYFADATIWLAAASIATTMDIRPAKDPQGEIITPNSRFVSGTVM